MITNSYIKKILNLKKIAKKRGQTLPQMALAWVNSRPFVTSNIIGATSLEQLETNIKSIGIQLTSDVLEQIEKIHRIYTYPSP